MTRRLSVADAEAMGLAPSVALDSVEGDYQVAAAWDGHTDAETTLLINVRATGSALLHTYEPLSGAWCSEAERLPPCPPDTAAPEIEVTVVTADGAIGGTFTAVVYVPRGLPWEEPDARLDVPYATFHGDASTLRGSLELQPPPGNLGEAWQFRLGGRGGVLRNEAGAADRAWFEITLQRMSFRSENA